MKIRKLPVQLLILAFTFASFGLCANDFQRIVKHVDNVPADVSHSVKKLSHYLVAPFSNKKDRYAAFYYWIAKNIKYNEPMSKKPLYYNNKMELIDYVIKNHNGVCQHFSELFAEMCHQVGLEAYVVVGYANLNNEKSSHTWNIINLDNKWLFVDATWAISDIGTSDTDKFPQGHFLISPQKHISVKMPYDPIWQALPSPISYNDFDNGNIKLSNGNYNFNDTIRSYITSNDFEKFASKASRMTENGSFNPLVKTEYELTKNNQRVIFENIQIKNFNKAGHLFNTGLMAYHKYVSVKEDDGGSTLKQGIEAEAMLKLINEALQYLLEAKRIIATVKPVDEKMKNLKVGIQKKITEKYQVLVNDKEELNKHILSKLD